MTLLQSEEDLDSYEPVSPTYLLQQVLLAARN